MAADQLTTKVKKISQQKMASFSAIKQASEEVQWIFVLVSKPLEAPNSCEFSYLCLTKSPKENGGFAPSTRKKSAKISTLSVSSCSEQSLKILCPVLQLQVKSFKDKYDFFSKSAGCLSPDGTNLLAKGLSLAIGIFSIEGFY